MVKRRKKYLHLIAIKSVQYMVTGGNCTGSIFFQRIIQSIIAGGKYPRRIEFWENKFPGRLSLGGVLVWEDRI